jgi:hypothetical protein
MVGTTAAANAANAAKQQAAKMHRRSRTGELPLPRHFLQGSRVSMVS